jgi:ubiquinone/menaquinone biosynthesis C-methylase UbiE
MTKAYVHGYDLQENIRLQDQANTLIDLLHSDTAYPAGSLVLEAGCGVGAQTLTLARNSPGASIVSMDISAASILQAEEKIRAAGLTNVRFQQGDLYSLPFAEAPFDHVFVCFVLEHLNDPGLALQRLKACLRPGGTMTVIEGDHGSAFFILTAMKPMPRFPARSNCSPAPAETRESEGPSIRCWSLPGSKKFGSHP